MKKIEIYVVSDTEKTFNDTLDEVLDMVGRGVTSAKITAPDFKIDFTVQELIELKTEDALDA